ncbi:hypothetical protein STEG23_014906, partial [Scotinomys teguina]
GLFPGTGDHEVPPRMKLSSERNSLTFGVSYTVPIHTPNFVAGKPSKLVMISL